MTSGHATVTLILFTIPVLFVIHPVSIPIPHCILRIPINLTTAPILAIAFLWVTQSIDATVIRNGIVGTEGIKPHNVLILLFSFAYMAITLDLAGTLRAAAFWVSNRSGDNGWKLYLYFYVLFTLISIVIGSDPVILSGTAFLVYYTRVALLDPRAWIMAEFAAANTASMVLFVGNPTNVVICEGFSLNKATFTAYTIIPFLACNIFCFAALAFQFRKEVWRRWAYIPHRRPRSALRDPVGALVGSFIIGATIILCLIASSIGIDVWMISLPFALTKLIFDLGWDCYRYSFGKPMVLDEDIDDGSSTMSQPQMEDSDSRHSLSMPTDVEQSQCTVAGLQLGTPTVNNEPDVVWTFTWLQPCTNTLRTRLVKRFPTFTTALLRLPFALIPFVFSQFILVEALDHQGWIAVFGEWLVRASHKEVHPTIWLIGALSIVLCNVSGTNIGATVLLTKVIRAAALPQDANLAAVIALAVATNLGAVTFTFSSSLSGLLWRAILKQQGIHLKQREFAFWNLLPLLVMTAVGLGVVSAEMVVLQSSSQHLVTYVTLRVEESSIWQWNP